MVLSVTPPGRYEIVRLMPPTVGGDNQYRIKSLHDGHERVVKESDWSTVRPDNTAPDGALLTQTQIDTGAPRARTLLGNRPRTSIWDNG